MSAAETRTVVDTREESTCEIPHANSILEFSSGAGQFAERLISKLRSDPWLQCNDSVRVRTKAMTAVMAAAVLSLTACMSQPPEAAPAEADNLWQQAREVTPGEPWLVGVGDSFISGEGGRCASNGTSNAQIPWNGGWLLGSSYQAY